MANDVKASFLAALRERYGTPRKLNKSQSLYDTPQGTLRLYIRYSKVHGDGRTFYGLRQDDLRELEGHASLICFLWEGQTEPLFIRFADYEDVFRSTLPARDGQYKCQIVLQEGATELYIAQAGRFGVEGRFGWAELESLVSSAGIQNLPEFSHSQMQTLLGAIGCAKGYDVWIPNSDRSRLDWSLTSSYVSRSVLPYSLQTIQTIAQEIDVIWMPRGSNEPEALFEVEHSTPIYSGLLRFNDVHLSAPGRRPRFSIVSNDGRRDIFVRQLSRPTFRLSGLSDLCTFLDYRDVFAWYSRIISPTNQGVDR